MMRENLATPALFKIKIFWNKGNDLIMSAHYVINNFLSHDSNDIVDVVICSKFGNSSISVRKVIVTSIFLKTWSEKPIFWEVLIFNNLGLTLDLEILHQCG